MGISEELVDVVSAEIGHDISYARLRDGTPEDVQYLTGIEVALLVGTGIFTAFLAGFTKGAAEKLGEATGKGVAAGILSAFAKIRGRLAEVDPRDARRAIQEARQQQAELDRIIAEELPRLTSRTPVKEEMFQEEIHEVATYLEDWGFPQEGKYVIAERIVRRVRREWHTEP